MRNVDDTPCIFCIEPNESARHLFFECCGNVFFLQNTPEIIALKVGADLESVAMY
jgi:hypothetical protein